MAVENIVNRSAGGRGLYIDGATVTITGHVVLEVPKAASLLNEIAEQHRLAMVEQLMEQGAATTAVVQASAHMVVLDNKVEELVEKLNRTLGEQLRTSGEHSTEVTDKLLTEHRERLEKLVKPFMDPNAKDGFPALMVELLSNAHRDAMKRMETMLSDADEGALARVVKQIVDRQKETDTTILKALAEREALRTKSSRRGGCFEEQLANRLPILARGIGRVEHCAAEAGEKGANTGDYLLTVDAFPASETVTIVIEAKSRQGRLSANKVRSELQKSRANRGAAVAILVADSADSLPDRLALNELSDRDLCVAYDPEDGDETALSCALYMAKLAALSTIVQTAGEGLDIAAAQHEVAVLREHLQRFSKIEACHSAIEASVTKGRVIAGDLKSEILNSLRRLDAILSS